jgi:hypothetical protein
MSLLMAPGTWVRHPERPDWGLGQVQSAVGDRVTVTFENAGKRLVRIATQPLEVLDDDAVDALLGGAGDP